MNPIRIVFCMLIGLEGPAAFAAAPPSEWRHQQRLETLVPGLVKVALPVETLDAARAGLEDLRLYDDDWNEVPYLIERPRPEAETVQSPKSFRMTLEAISTVLTIETGFSRSLDAVTLETPAKDFMKAVQIEGSADGRQWQTLARGQPLFSQPGVLSQWRLPVPRGSWPWLRLTVDDHRSAPIPFTGARIHIPAADLVPTESLPVRVVEQHENPGESRITLDLGAANIDLASMELETSEPIFTRPVRLAVSQVSAGVIQERTVAQGAIYRVAVEDQPAAANLVLRVESRIPSREAVLFILNQDSPPLPLLSVRAQRRPVYLTFLARSAGGHHLLTGNGHCPAPNYDLAGLAANLKTVALSPITVSALTDNPHYRVPELLPGLPQGDSALDVAPWRFRKAIKEVRAGAQESELDLEVLAHADPGFADLRLVRDGNQLPYILERTSISRSLTRPAAIGRDPKNLRVERWTLKLPQPGLPLTRLTCVARNPLFQREVMLFEEVVDDRGETRRQPLGRATWVQTPSRASREFGLAFDRPPQTDTVILQTDNGDNSAIDLDAFQLFYPATHILFKTDTGKGLFLYYGNPGAPAPRYDLSLVAGELLAAEKAVVSLGAEELLKNSPRWNHRTPGQGGVLFWGILALVVVILLVLISRLLPKPPSTSPPG